MAIGAGNNITATDFNALVVAVNKYWGDNVPSAAVTDPDRSTHKYGWGQTHALELSGTDDRVAATETVEARLKQTLIITGLLILGYSWKLRQSQSF